MGQTQNPGKDLPFELGSIDIANVCENPLPNEIVWTHWKSKNINNKMMLDYS